MAEFQSVALTHFLIVAAMAEHCGLKVSMSGTGNCCDNAPMEIFWGTLKPELVHHRRYASRKEGA